MFSFAARWNHSISKLRQWVDDCVDRFLKHHAIFNFLWIWAKFRWQSWDLGDFQTKNSWLRRVERSTNEHVVVNVVGLLKNWQRNDNWTVRVDCGLRRCCTFFRWWHVFLISWVRTNKWNVVVIYSGTSNRLLWLLAVASSVGSGSVNSFLIVHIYSL